MKTRREARIWLYRDAVAASLRKHLNDTRFLPKGLTPVGTRRVQAEMEKLADQLEARAARLQLALDIGIEPGQDDAS